MTRARKLVEEGYLCRIVLGVPTLIRLVDSGHICTGLGLYNLYNGTWIVELGLKII
jgi:hypothetical protein